MGELGLDRVRMELRSANPSAKGRADRHLRVVSPARPETVSRELEADLMEGLMCEAKELDLSNRHYSANCQSKERPHDGALRHRRIDNTIGAEA